MKLSLSFVVFAAVFGLGMAGGEWEKSKSRGKVVFESYCVACHLGSGQGIVGAFPPLAKSDYLMADTERAVRGIKYGLSGEIVVNGVKYNNYMAEMGLSDQEIADVMNYILNSWGNKSKKMITAEFVKAVKE
ncbi:MAG: cytochrome c [Bacteroidia bacterium]|nr:cytochrome c [Bacteroidia bacterium]